MRKFYKFQQIALNTGAVEHWTNVFKANLQNSIQLSNNFNVCFKSQRKNGPYNKYTHV